MAEEKVINVVVEEEKTLDRIKRMAKKAKNKALDGVEWMIDNPGKTVAAITGTTAAVKAVTELARTVTGPAKARRESRRYYDRFNSCRYIDTKRELSSREAQELDYYVQSGGRAVDWLRMKKLLR